MTRLQRHRRFGRLGFVLSTGGAALALVYAPIPEVGAAVLGALAGGYVAAAMICAAWDRSSAI